MKIVFFGSDDYSVPHLETLLEISEIVLVVTTPDAPKGRGRKVKPTPVKEFALSKNLEVASPEKLRDESFLSRLHRIEPDVGIVASYGKLIPNTVMNAFKIGVFCVHPSLLPKYRGAAPIERAIENGEKRTGVTVFKIVERLDAGPIALQKSFELGPFETYGEIFEKAIALGKHMLWEFFDMLKGGKLELVPQDDSKATYAPKITKDDLKVNFEIDCERVKDKIRAYDPKPGAFAYLNGERVKLFGVRSISGFFGKPGEIVEITKKGAWISCDGGSVLVERLQFPGKRIMSFWDAKNGSKLREGDVLL